MKPFVLSSLALLWILASGEESLAEKIDDGWATFASSCSIEMQLPLEQLGKSGLVWSKDSQENIRDLKQMAEVTCPAYLHKRNDPVALQAFQQEKAKVLDRSPLVKKEADRLLALLRVFSLDYQKTFAHVGIDFSRSPCGLQVQRIEKGMAERMLALETRIKGLVESCASVARGEEESALRQKQVDQPGEPLPQQRPGKRESTISGEIPGEKGE